jgi:hypothetical protein
VTDVIGAASESAIDVVDRVVAPVDRDRIFGPDVEALRQPRIADELRAAAG